MAVEGSVQTAHAGLFLLLPELIALDLPGLVKAAGWPSTSQLDALHSVLSLLTLKLSGRRRRSHVANVVHDPALGLFCRLNVLPKTWHLKTYSYRTTRCPAARVLRGAAAPTCATQGCWASRG